MLYDNQLSVVAAAEGGNITGSRSRSRLNNISSTAGTASPRPSTPNRGGSNGINAVDPRHQPLRFTPLGNERLQAIKEHALRWVGVGLKAVVTGGGASPHNSHYAYRLHCCNSIYRTQTTYMTCA